ncbi:MAG: alpha,alpha-trehalase TreF [Ginsengibacter sp.]
MIKLLFALIIMLFSMTSIAQHLTPRQLYPGLFEDIQLSDIYPDSKTFPDVIPLKDPKKIMKNYLVEKNKPGFSIKEFAQKNFKLPPSKATGFVSNPALGLRHHIDTLWTVLHQHVSTPSEFSTSLIPLPNAYIIPGGRFREVYYWDSYFTMLGLKEAGKISMIEEMVDNFAWLIKTVGFIPNGNRTYYLTRSQPPYFSQMVALLASVKGEDVLIKYCDALEKEYNFWMKGRNGLKPGSAKDNVVMLGDGSVLNRYWDAGDYPREESYKEDLMAAKKSKQISKEFYRNIRAAAESGLDFSSRWFADGQTLGTIITTDFLAVDLNGLLFHLENTIAKANKLKGDFKRAELFLKKSKDRKSAMQKYFWNPSLDCFTDYNWKLKEFSTQKTLAGLMPLYFNLATKEQAGKVALLTEKEFLKPGGLLTTLKNTGEQWDAPNGWPPLEWISIVGLNNYGYKKLADTIATRWIKINTDVFMQTGKLMEKYNVSDMGLTAGGGEYPLQDGFGWTNGVLLSLLNKYSSK